MMVGVCAVGVVRDKPPENTVPASSKGVKSHPSLAKAAITVSFRSVSPDDRSLSDVLEINYLAE